MWRGYLLCWWIDVLLVWHECAMLMRVWLKKAL